MWSGGGDGGSTLAGVPQAEMPFGAPGICFHAEAAEREVHEGFPYEPRYSADGGAPSDATRFRGADMSWFCLQRGYKGL